MVPTAKIIAPLTDPSTSVIKTFFGGAVPDPKSLAYDVLSTKKK